MEVLGIRIVGLTRAGDLEQLPLDQEARHFLTVRLENDEEAMRQVQATCEDATSEYEEERNAHRTIR